jgi:hypothetical protein
VRNTSPRRSIISLFSKGRTCAGVVRETNIGDVTGRMMK